MKKLEKKECVYVCEEREVLWKEVSGLQAFGVDPLSCKALSKDGESSLKHRSNYNHSNACTIPPWTFNLFYARPITQSCETTSNRLVITLVLRLWNWFGSNHIQTVAITYDNKRHQIFYLANFQLLHTDSSWYHHHTPMECHPSDKDLTTNTIDSNLAI